MKDYKKLWGDIAPFVDFNIDGRKTNATYSKSDKWRIARYANLIKEYSSGREKYIYKGRNKDRLKQAQQYAGQRIKGEPHLKVAFIPNMNPDGEKPNLVFRKGKTLRVKYKYTTEDYIDLDNKRMVTEGKAYITDELTKSGHNQFNIIAGSNMIPQSFDLSKCVDEIEVLMNSYPNVLEDGRKNENGYKYWLFGVYGYNLDNQKFSEKERLEFIAARANYKAGRKKKGKNKGGKRK